MIILDTNFVIYLLNKDPTIEYLFKNFFLQNKDIGVSFITKIELLSFHDLSEAEVKDVYHFLTLVQVILLNDFIVDRAILIRSQHKLKIPDAIVAATALIANAEFYTRDKKDFSKVPGLKLKII